MPITTVVFDVGETLVDETRHWGEWADWMGVSRLTFYAAMGAVIERGWHHRTAFQLVRPGFDVEAAVRQRADQGYRYRIERRDFFPDALPCLSELRRRGYRIGLAGNQPEEAEAALAAAGARADFITSSARLGVEKPSFAFFHGVIDAAERPASEIAYVGDRLDNDVVPARDVGMTAVFLRRGPWGHIHAGRPEAARAHLALDSLSELARALGAL
jgi:HAD superfamily hydrolase (TIGR01549 family)